jgi:hypothetical protein
MPSGNQARRYFDRLIAKTQTAAEFVRRDAAKTTDPARRAELEAEARRLDAQVEIYRTRRREIID